MKLYTLKKKKKNLFLSVDPIAFVSCKLLMYEKLIKEVKKMEVDIAIINEPGIDELRNIKSPLSPQPKMESAIITER